MQSLLYSQIDTVWTKTIGENDHEVGYSVQQTKDGGYIIAGRKEFFIAPYLYQYDVWLFKTDSIGNLLWSKIYGGGSDEWDFTVQQTVDGGYILAGNTRSFSSGTSDIWMLKTNSVGDTLWTKLFDGGIVLYGNSIIQTSDGGFIITGGYNRNFLLMKTNSFGDTIWTKSGSGKGTSIRQTRDGGYIIGGNTYNNNVINIQIIKTDSLGNTIWSNNYSENNNEECYLVIETTDGDYVIVGYTTTNNFGADGYLVKTNSYGDTLWTKKIGGNNNDLFKSIIETSDGGYLISGFTESFGAGGIDIWLIKTNSFGDTLWTKTFGDFHNDDSYSIIQTNDNGYLIGGNTHSFRNGSLDIWLIKTTPDINSILLKNDIIKMKYSLKQNYPNPFNPLTTISFTIPKTSYATLVVYNIRGKKITSKIFKKLSAGTHQYNFDASHLSTGVYFYQLVAGEYQEVKKMLFIK